MIKVKLLDYTPEPERVVAMAARLCYSASGAEELAERLSEEKVREMVRKMVKIGHGSTLEHASFTFGIEGVSRVLTHQLVRHRIASYDQQSQRYVAEHDFEYILPPSIEEKPEAKERFQSLMDDIQKAYNELADMGIPKEDARYVLANATETKIDELPIQCTTHDACVKHTRTRNTTALSDARSVHHNRIFRTRRRHLFFHKRMTLFRTNL